MHILMIPYVYPPRDNPGKHGTYFVEQAELIRQGLGWQCNVLDLRVIRARCGEEVAEDIETLPDGGAVWRATVTYRFPLNRVSAWSKLGSKIFLSYMEKHGKPDLIWIHKLSGPGRLVQKLQQQFKIPYFIHEHSNRYQSSKRISFRWRRQLRKIAQDAVYCAVVGERQRSAIAKQLGMSETMLKIIHNPVGAPFARTPDYSHERADGRFTFTSVGRLEKRKNQVALLQAFTRFLREEDPEARLQFVGEGPHREKLTHMIQELQLENSVTLTGSLGREEVRNVLYHKCFYAS